jgi:hypothetical protein
LFLLNFQLFPQVLINEISSSNFKGIKDEDGDYSDWIEVYNKSASEINLYGYHLSDDAFFMSKWTFPAITLKPDSFLLIFASAKNRADKPLTYQTVIPGDAVWSYLVPSSNIGTSWRNRAFDASAWKTGKSGFGYGDGDDATVLNNVVSVFIRKEFVISDIKDVEELVLSIDYDDGFAAFINGYEIARNNLGAPGSVIAYNQLTGSFSREATMYQGGLPENFLVRDPGRFLVEGLNVIAIQCHNSAANSSDLTLIPLLTLGLSGTGYTDNHPDYIIPSPKPLHTNFKLSSLGETVILSNPDSSQVDSVAAVSLLADISYGRKPDGSDSWFFFSPSTPGKTNSGRGYDHFIGDSVKFSYTGGYFPGGMEVSLSTVDPSDTIVYTLNGSEPATGDAVYTKPILVTKNIVVRAKALNAQKLPGVVATNTYFTKKHTLPVVCLTTDSVNLWDYNYGIYVLGPNAAADNPYFGANFWQDWERRAHMELYDADGNRQIDQDIGIKIAGAWSRANPQKSMALFARTEYGKGAFNYKVFKDKPIEKFEALLLRNGGNDWPNGILRDGLTSTLVRDMDIDRMAFQPSIVYINGEYWGILNMREKVNSNYLAENHFINPEKVNLLEGDGAVIEGANTSYLGIKTFLNTTTLEAEQNYTQVSDKIDINNYIQYQLTEIFINNKDWPGNNIKFWNTSDPGSLWRWILYDTDFGLSLWDNPAAAINTLKFALDPSFPDGWPNPPWSTLLFRRMISNKGFREEFANQYADRLNTNFTPVRTLAALDSLKRLYLPEISDHLNRWGLNYSNWINNLTSIKVFLSARPANARNHIQTELGIGPKTNITVVINSPEAGKVRVNSVIPESYPFNGVYFQGLPIRLTAIPAPGYKFTGWLGTVSSASVSIDYNMIAAGTFTAVFEIAGSMDYNIIINEINYNSSPDKDTKDWVELYNAGKATVNLKNWIVSDGIPETGYVIPSDLIILPGAYVIVCRDIAAFRMLKPELLSIIGDMSFGLGSTGDDINLFDPDKKLVDWVNYTPNLPWPTEANGTGASIELIDPLADNNLGGNWKSSPDGGTPGELNLKSLGIEVKHIIPVTDFTLDCFPNPFTDYTTVRITVPVSARYKLEVFNIQGSLISILAEQDLDSGAFTIDWDGKDQNNQALPGGVYVFRLSGENQTLNQKVILIK